MSSAELPAGWANASELLRARLAALPTAGVLGHDEAEILYGMGYVMLEQKRYAEARSVFHVLSSYRPLEKKFWHGLGHALKMLGMLDEAMHAYAILAVIHPALPDASLCMAECQLLAGETERAAETLQLVIDFCEAHPGFDPIAVRANAMNNLLSASAPKS